MSGGALPLSLIAFGGGRDPCISPATLLGQTRRAHRIHGSRRMGLPVPRSRGENAINTIRTGCFTLPLFCYRKNRQPRPDTADSAGPRETLASPSTSRRERLSSSSRWPGLSPMTESAPSHLRDLAFPIVAHHGHGLGGSDVVARCDGLVEAG
jgi:hypothetical protein